MNVDIQQEAIDQLGEPLHKEYVSSWCLLLPACLCLSVLMMVDDAGKQASGLPKKGRGTNESLCFSNAPE
ncbi:hypothetical protein [Bacillus subtilis]|uniref:hypothetical protein n=1 Tax=Bacillus subtilis TaxID=1423 RepID=UPI001BDB9D67|nr:hypothetical protein [Bacillus subtilis]